MMSKRFFVISLIVIGLLINSFSFVVHSQSGIFLIVNSQGWHDAGFDDLGIYYNRDSLTEFYMPIAIKKEDVHNLLDKDIEHTIYNKNQNFTERLRTIDFEILQSDTYYVVVYHMLVYASNKTFQIDFVPKIKGEELSQFAWWNSNWDYFRTIAIDSDKIETSLVNFPILVRITDALADECNDGNSIRFLDTDNTTEYKYEIENWIDDKDRIVWVKIPRVDSASDTVFLMYYGNPDANDNQHNSSVWTSNYLAVYHMNNLTDMTGNGYILTNNGADIVTTGQMGDCYQFIQANDDYMTQDTLLDTFPVSEETTWEVWFNDNSPVDEYNILMRKVNHQWNDRIYLFVDVPSTKIKWGVESNDDGLNYVIPNVIISANVWYYTAGLYKNGVPISANVNTTTDFSLVNEQNFGDGNAEDFSIGNIQNVGKWNGYIDEIRISSVKRNASWLNATYHSTNDTTNFLIWGSEQVKPLPPSAVSLNITISYPLNNSIDICPCNDYMSVTIETNGTNNMNLSFYHSITDISEFHLMEKYYNITNGMYAFCMCGHSFVPAYITWHDNGIQTVLVAGTWYNITFNESVIHPSKNINHSWDNSNNDTFTILEDGIYNIRYQMLFVDTAVNPTSVIEGRIIQNENEIHGSLISVETHTQDKLESIGCNILEQLYYGDKIKLQFTASADTVNLQSHIHYGDAPYSSMIWIERVDDSDSHPMHYNETYYWYVNVSEYGNDSNYNVSDIYTFNTMTDASDCDILSATESDDLFLSSAFELTTDSLILLIWMFFIILSEWKADWVYKILQLPIGLTYGVTLLGANVYLGLGVIFASIYILAIAYWQSRKPEGET